MNDRSYLLPHNTFIEALRCTIMVTLYLTGAISSDRDDPFKWHDDLIGDDMYTHIDFINPYTLNDFELGDADIYDRPHEIVNPALDAIESADGMLVRWDDDAFLVGTAMEMKHAFDHDVPIVVWYEGWRDNLSPWILHTTRGTFDDRHKAIRILSTYAGDTSFL